MMSSAHDPASETVEAVEAIDRVETETEVITARARQKLSEDAESEANERLGQVFDRAGVSWYPLMALSALVIVDEFQGYAFNVLAPDIAASLGISIGGVALLLGLKTLMVALAALAMASYVQKKPRRAQVALLTGVGWTIVTFATGFVVSVWGLLAVLMIGGAATGSTRSVHQPLLLDHYPQGSRMRVLSFYRGADSFGNVLAPLLVVLFTLAIDATWRGVFLGMGLGSVVGLIVALRLRDPGFGRFDEEIVEQVIAEHETAEPLDLTDEAVQLGFFEIVKRVMMIATIRRLLVAVAVLGVFLVPLAAIVAFFLEDRFGLDATQRALFFAMNAGVSIIALRLYSRHGEKRFASDPRGVMNQTALTLFAAMMCLILGALMPNLILVGVFLAVAFSLTVTLAPPLYLAMFSVVSSRMRPHVAALFQIYLAGVGGLLGAIFLGSIERRFGLTGALISMLFPAAIGAWVMRSARETLVGDMERLISDQIEEREVEALRSRGVALPMLACRGIDFSYGQLQVLFGVDFTVDEGEMVAMLGTNGAGKSTLLRVISGLGLPERGSVRFVGKDITFVGSERRVGLGICQIPGGRAVFPPLTVVENLRLYAHQHRRDRRRTAQGIEETFEVFPILHERRNQLAVTLSGGEQQMLGLAQAFILRPRLLLIDELSLGLAPIIVEQLLTMVRRINEAGSAVVLVEQSVTVALSIVEHAYFMEKGEIRFDGRASELINRTDIVRAVFLEGAAQGISTASRVDGDGD